MSTALAVCHGSFGRVTVYQLDKPMRTHAHREGHLTFHLGGPPAMVTIAIFRTWSTKLPEWPSIRGSRIPFILADGDHPSVFLVAYICDHWLDRDQRARGSLRFGAKPFGSERRMRSICASLAHTLVTNASYRMVHRYFNQLFDACFDESWASGGRPACRAAAAADRLSRPQIAAHPGRWACPGHRARRRRA